MKNAKALKVSIPKPCHEDWNQMSPEAKGRHCASCSKIVTDFTSMTDRELVEHLQRNVGGCGRFRSDQLNRSLPKLSPSRLWAMPRFIESSVLALFTAVVSALANLEARAQAPTLTAEITIGDTVYAPHPEMRSISGHVSSAGRPLIGASVYIPALSMEKHYTDAEGNFHFEIPWTIEVSKMQLIVEHANFAMQAYPLNRGTVELFFELEPQVCEPIPPPVIMGIPAMEMGEVEIMEIEEGNPKGS